MTNHDTRTGSETAIPADVMEAEEDLYLDWQQRGAFKCDHCDRVLSTLGGLRSHTEMRHGVTAVALRAKLRADQKAVANAEKARREAEQKRLEARKARVVILSTDDVDEIVSEMESLIGMMEAYWSQGDCDKGARALINRLEAMADGHRHSLSTPTQETTP